MRIATCRQIWRRGPSAPRQLRSASAARGASGRPGEIGEQKNQALRYAIALSLVRGEGVRRGFFLFLIRGAAVSFGVSADEPVVSKRTPQSPEVVSVPELRRVAGFTRGNSPEGSWGVGREGVSNPIAKGARSLPSLNGRVIPPLRAAERSADNGFLGRRFWKGGRRRKLHHGLNGVLALAAFKVRGVVVDEVSHIREIEGEGDPRVD